MSPAIAVRSAACRSAKPAIASSWRSRSARSGKGCSTGGSAAFPENSTKRNMPLKSGPVAGHPPAGPLDDPAQCIAVEVGNMRVDHLPAGGGQVVAGIRDLQIAVHRSVPGQLTQPDQEAVRVVQVLQPVPGGDQVENWGVAVQPGGPAVEHRAGRVRADRAGVHRVVADAAAAAVRHSSRRNSPCPQPMSSTVRQPADSDRSGAGPARWRMTGTPGSDAGRCPSRCRRPARPDRRPGCVRTRRPGRRPATSAQRGGQRRGAVGPVHPAPDGIAPRSAKGDQGPPPHAAHRPVAPGRRGVAPRRARRRASARRAGVGAGRWSRGPPQVLAEPPDARSLGSAQPLVPPEVVRQPVPSVRLDQLLDALADRPAGLEAGHLGGDPRAVTR